jgi:glycosyltransferase involved in cell wall biosynthesis
MIDFIEHLGKEAGERLLEVCKKIARKKIFVFTPLVFSNNGANVNNPKCWAYGNKFDYHKSFWSMDDFAGWETIQLTPKDFFGYWEKKNSVSVVMTSYRRVPQLRVTLESIYRQDYPVEVIVVEDGDDGGETKRVCEEGGAIYLQRKNRPDLIWSNPSVPTNIGLRAATGDIVILQSAEVKHTGDLIRELSNRVDDSNAVFPSVMALNEDGTDNMWYVHSQYRRLPFFFCGAMKRKWFNELRGLDEDFKLGGFDDNDFAARLGYAGVRFDYEDDLLALHQWHGISYALVPLETELFKEKFRKLQAGEIGVARNLGREWGTE